MSCFNGLFTPWSYTWVKGSLEGIGYLCRLTNVTAITGLDPPYGKELLSVLNGSETETKATSIENMWNKKIQQQHQ